MALLIRPAMIAVLAALLLAAVLLFARRSDAPATVELTDLNQLRAAYARVVPGMPAQRLALLGFDRSRPGVQTLSMLGVMEFFMPKDSGDFDRLDPAIRSCLAAADRCGAYVFPLEAQTDGALGLAAHAAPSDGRIVFLVKSGRVAWKGMGR
jgi:hypothetical protein